MKSEKRILLAFILNLAFSLFELIGGLFTGSVAILSDSVHDIGDATGIGVSYFLEKKSLRQPDRLYTYGYARYSVIGSMISTLILLLGSILVICNAISRIVSPTEIDYTGMIVVAVIGICVNACAALFTHGGSSLNQRSVNLHMLEDVLGWIVVLVGAIVMRITDFALLDPLLSIGVAVFILVNALQMLKATTDLILEKAPQEIDVDEIKHHLCDLDGVLDVHHIHVWSMDGQKIYATMHIVMHGDAHTVKDRVRQELAAHGIGHATLELEEEGEHCHEEHCHIETTSASGHRHGHPHSHHHHHHHSPSDHT